MEFGKKMKNNDQVFAYSINDDEYANLIEEGTADNSLKIFCPNNKLIRTLEFKSPVKQIMSCRHHEGDAEADKIYILLWNGMLYKVSQRVTYT